MFNSWEAFVWEVSKTVLARSPQLPHTYQEVVKEVWEHVNASDVGRLPVCARLQAADVADTVDRVIQRLV